jgi:hypothetical protein
LLKTNPKSSEINLVGEEIFIELLQKFLLQQYNVNVPYPPVLQEAKQNPSYFLTPFFKVHDNL